MHYVRKNNKFFLIGVLCARFLQSSMNQEIQEDSLSLAIKHNNLLLAQTALAAKIDVNLVDKHGAIPLHCSVALDRLAITELLLAAKADVCQVDQHGKAPLHYAAFPDHPAIAQLLIQARADIDKTDQEGYTPLHYATLLKKTGMIQELIWAGAMCDYSSIYHRTSRDYAKKEGPEFLAFFEKTEKERAALPVLQKVITKTLSGTHGAFFLQEEGLARYLTEYLVTPAEALEMLTQ